MGHTWPICRSFVKIYVFMYEILGGIMNQIIIAYHAVCHGEVHLSPELVDYRLYAPQSVKCWPAGTGYALADWLKSRGYTPNFIEFPKQD
jgi:NAD+ diphosphatase